jgi:transposase InsO family protein
MGIRRMKYHLRQECRFWVSRKAVWDALKVVDMEGLLARREHRLERRIFHADGPDQVWSVDGHDKIARWGFPIHGCNDVFSRYLIWLRVGDSNHDPRYILAYYLDGIEEIARNRGSENCNPLIVLTLC